MNLIRWILLAFLFLSSCVEDPIVPVPEFGPSTLISDTNPLSDSTKKRLEGIFTVLDGKAGFGNHVVAKWNGNYLSIFTSAEMKYMILQAGYLDSVVFLEGYWRNALNLQTGLVRMTIKKSEGGRALIYGQTPPDTLILRGAYSDGSELPHATVVFQFFKPLKNQLKNYWIIGHRGGGRTTDLLPASENSVGIFPLAERYGCNGVEIDVRLTRDRVPVLYHDEFFSSRLVNGDFMIGPVSSYTFRQIRSFCTLKDGSPVPTLREALDAVIYNTHLSFVWIDTKPPDIMDILIPMQKEYMQKARDAGRDLEILIGIPDENILSAYAKHPDHLNAPALCELGTEKVRQIQAKIWAPRWTLGQLDADVDAMHRENRRAFVWTLDNPDFIRVFVTDGKFDGILTNYPSRVAWEYYMKMNFHE